MNEAFAHPGPALVSQSPAGDDNIIVRPNAAPVSSAITPVAIPGTGVTLDPAGAISPKLLTGYPNSTSKFLRGDGTWAAASGELSYTEITTNGTSTATTSATATAVITAGAVTFDGATTVILEVSCPYVSHSVASTNIFLNIYDGSTELGVIAQAFSAAAGAGAPVRAARRLTPSAGSHTYSVRMYSGAGATATFAAGTGAAGAFYAAFLRISKA